MINVEKTGNLMATEIDRLHVNFWAVWYDLRIVLCVVMCVGKDQSNETACNWLGKWHIHLVFLL